MGALKVNTMRWLLRTAIGAQNVTVQRQSLDLEKDSKTNQMKIDHYYQTHNRRINARFKPETILRHQDRWMAALENKRERERGRPSDWHRHVVTQYYARLLRRFGLKALHKAIAKVKCFVWEPANLAILERHL